MEKITLEVCVDSVESAIAAQKGGADRIELCSNLLIGGTTPGYELYQMVRAEVSLPIHVLIRPRFGDFLYSDFEMKQMIREAEWFTEHGADALVTGILKKDGTLDAKRMAAFTEIAEGVCSITLHRAFDMCCDPFAAAEQADAMGIQRILTSGQRNTCMQGKEVLKKLTEYCAKKRIEIMAGGGIAGIEDVKHLYSIGIRSFHMSGKTVEESHMKYRNSDICMGVQITDEYTIWKTSEEKIRKVKYDLK